VQAGCPSSIWHRSALDVTLASFATLFQTPLPLYRTLYVSVGIVSFLFAALHVVLKALDRLLSAVSGQSRYTAMLSLNPNWRTGAYLRHFGHYLMLVQPSSPLFKFESASAHPSSRLFTLRFILEMGLDLVERCSTARALYMMYPPFSHRSYSPILNTWFQSRF
jgi:hypothetical protein